jgi:hypothetical protein
MRFKNVLFPIAAPALMLASCENAPQDDADAGESKPVEIQGTPDIVKATDAVPAPDAAKLEGTWNCEDQGDVQVTFKHYSDGTGTLATKNMSEMAASQEASIVRLEATGASAGYNDRSGRMRSADGSSTVWFLNDGRVEVTEGSGTDEIRYMCDRAG